MGMGVKLGEEFTEWAKIPKAMQHQFFELAEKEAMRTKARLLENQAKLDRIRRLVKFRDVSESNEWKGWRVCVVDGSDSPVMSERVGGRFGTYGATYHIYEGLELVEEDYFSGLVIDLQVGDSEASKKMLSLLATCLERDVALSCLDKDVDLLLVDGSFFGFRPRCRIIHPRKVPNTEFKDGTDLTKHVRDASIRLVESGKAVGIIKRVQAAALDGWSIYRNGNDNMVLNRNDKEILSSSMKEKQWFSYESAFGDPILYNYFTRLALAYNRYAVDTSRTIESIFKACKDDVDRNVRRDLLCDSARIFRTSRYFIRCSYPSPPFCFETPIDYELNNLLGFFVATCNRATGLPLPLDLTDQDITMPTGFTQEFVEEIEANLVKDPDLDKYEIANHFASLNPQKQE
jgi:hypothetical protein